MGYVDFKAEFIFNAKFAESEYNLLSLSVDTCLRFIEFIENRHNGLQNVQKLSKVTTSNWCLQYLFNYCKLGVNRSSKSSKNINPRFRGWLSSDIDASSCTHVSFISILRLTE